MAGHGYTITTQTGILIVRQEGVLSDASEAHRMQSAIELSRTRHRPCGILFDNRKTGASPEAVRKQMWEWVMSAGFERVALLLKSEMAVIRANMDALSKRTSLRAFSEEDEAVAWLKPRGPQGR